jgi:hypothetical protein
LRMVADSTAASLETAVDIVRRFPGFIGNQSRHS